VLDLCDFEPIDRLIGIIYLGWATGQSPASERIAPTVTVVD
jgi:hypothetical protein